MINSIERNVVDSNDTVFHKAQFDTNGYIRILAGIYDNLILGISEGSQGACCINYNVQ